MSLPCVVLGGGEGVLVDPAAPFKGMARVAGRPMIEWVLEALREAGTIGEITAVVPRRIDSEPWPALTDGIVVSDATFIENVLAGLARYGDDERVLVVTSDVPAITPGAIDSFVLESLRRGADLTYPLVDAEDMEAAFPGSQRTYVRVDGRSVTGGNVVVLTTRLVRQERGLGERLFQARKSAVKLASILGPVFIAKYVAGTLRTSDVERRIERLSGASCAALRVREASVGADVDKPDDAIVVERVLYRRASIR